MRVYLAADADALRALRSGEAVQLPELVAPSDDEQDEFDTLVEVAATARVVVVAETNSAGEPVTLLNVAALHVDADGSGDLAWYATQEIDAVLAMLEA